MPDNYSGNPANVTTPLSASIISCSSGAGGLVLVGTSGAHHFATYDYVTISGVLGTTEANTTTSITVVDSSSFLLDGVPFVNAYSSGGTAEDLSLTPYFQVPSDGEQGTVQAILASIQCIADRTQYLQRFFGLGVNVVTATATVKAPPFASRALLRGVGGGGGGGAGAGADGGGGSTHNGGGGGGGGAIASEVIVSVTPGSPYLVTIGAGGTAGAPGASGANGGNGGNGGDSTFGSLALFPGGYGGAGGVITTDGEGGAGGGPNRLAVAADFIPGTGGDGGEGASNHAGLVARVPPVLVGSSQGTGGSGGSGGGGGGAGGSSSWPATGGNGGNGGSAINAPPPTAGAAGGSYGAGGGGGGASAVLGGGGTAAGAAGGAGYQGRIDILWLR